MQSRENFWGVTARARLVQREGGIIRSSGPRDAASRLECKRWSVRCADACLSFAVSLLGWSGDPKIVFVQGVFKVKVKAAVRRRGDAMTD